MNNPDVTGSGNLESALDKVVDTADDFLTGGELTIEHIRSLSTSTLDVDHGTQNKSSPTQGFVTTQRQQTPSASLMLDVPDSPVDSDPGAGPAGILEERYSSSRREHQVSPLPRVKSPRRIPSAPATVPTPSSSQLNQSTPSQKKKGGLPRVAMLAQTSAKKIEPKKSTPPPFRAGGRVNSFSSSPSPTARRTTSTPPRSSEFGIGKTYSRQDSVKSPAQASSFRGTGTASDGTRPRPGSGSSRGTLGASASSVSARSMPSRNMSPGNVEQVSVVERTTSSSRPRRPIVKPDENISRAIKESKALSKVDSLNSADDDMKNLQGLLTDIKELKTALGVENSTEAGAVEAHEYDADAESNLLKSSEKQGPVVDEEGKIQQGKAITTVAEGAVDASIIDAAQLQDKAEGVDDHDQQQDKTEGVDDHDQQQGKTEGVDDQDQQQGKTEGVDDQDQQQDKTGDEDQQQAPKGPQIPQTAEAKDGIAATKSPPDSMEASEETIEQKTDTAPAHPLESEHAAHVETVQAKQLCSCVMM